MVSQNNFLDVVVVHCWLQYRKDCRTIGFDNKEIIPLLDFKMQVANSLMKTETEELQKEPKRRRRPSNAVEQKKKRRPPAIPMPDKAIRQDRFSHWLIWDEKKGRCAYPGCKGIIKTKCMKYNTHICCTPNSNFFRNFHEH